MGECQICKKGHFFTKILLDRFKILFLIYFYSCSFLLFLSLLPLTLTHGTLFWIFFNYHCFPQLLPLLGNFVFFFFFYYYLILFFNFFFYISLFFLLSLLPLTFICLVGNFITFFLLSLKNDPLCKKIFVHI